MTVGLEHQHEDVFGKSFALYTKLEMEAFIEPFRVRFTANGIDAQAQFADKRCLDAGCGNGRGSIWMMMNGAASIDCVDISESNIASTKRNLADFGFAPRSAMLSSLETIPFDDAVFDFVWCNGVVMHTANPDRCLSELARVLKVGGRAWIYVYGAGGLYWYAVQRFRHIMRTIDAERCLAALRLLRYDTRYVAEYMDDWKVPYLRTYTNQDFSSRLHELGFVDANPLPHGMTYDTSHRRTKYPDDAVWFGEGDLRYLVTKTSQPQSPAHPISDSEIGSEYQQPHDVTERFSPLFDELESVIKGNELSAVAACAHVQRDLREIMSDDGPLRVDAFEAMLRRVVQLADAARMQAPRS